MIDSINQLFHFFDWQGWVVLTLLIITLFLLIKEVFPIEMTLFVAGMIPVILGIVSKEKFLQSLFNESIITIAMLFIVVQAFEQTGLISFISKKVLPKEKSDKVSLFFLLPPISFMSAFLNNTPIVMALVPVFRKWCAQKKLYPSKFLIPLSFAAILGGICTLIGTSTNLVINGLLQSENIAYSLKFFEIGKIGVPCAIVGLIYLMIFSNKLLPERKNPDHREVKNMTSEFSVEKGCSWIGKSIKTVNQEFLHGQAAILKIQRANQKIDVPGANETIQEKDKIVILADPQQIASLHTIEGLKHVEDYKFDLEKQKQYSYYSEILIPAASYLVGKTLRSVNYRNRYGGFVFAIYREGKSLSDRVSEIELKAGDILMLLSSKARDRKYFESKDVYPIRVAEEITTFSPVKAFFVFAIFLSMVLLAAFGFSIMIASMAASSILLLSKLVSANRALMKINWNLLILIAGGFALFHALDATGVARVFGEGFVGMVGRNPYIIIAIIFFTTAVLTEFITNTAAALILFPVFYQAMKVLNYDSAIAIKAVGITIAIAASCSFISPIGYQTNTIVYGPGGYRFLDYMKIGLPLSFIVGIICIFLIPVFWPFV